MDTTDAGRSLAQRRWSKPKNVQLRVDKLAEHITALVESAPPLTAEQVDKLRALLPPVNES